MGGAKARVKVSHTGSTFDGFLDKQGFRKKVEAVAINRVLTWQQAVELRSTGQPRPAVPTRDKKTPTA